MLSVEDWAEIRRLRRAEQVPIAQIARVLGVGDETVKSHAKAIYRKLGVSDRAGAVAAALREGLFQ